MPQDPRIKGGDYSRMFYRFPHILAEIPAEPVNAISPDDIIRINYLIDIIHIRDMSANHDGCPGTVGAN